MPKINVSFCGGCKVQIECNQNKIYRIDIKDGDEVLISALSKNIQFEKTYFVDYLVEVFCDDVF